MKVVAQKYFTNRQGSFIDPTLLDRKKISGGFTLLEVIAGLAITMLLIGGVYSIANGALELGVRSSGARKAAVREMNFTKVMRSTLARLGPGVEVSLSPAHLTLAGETGILDVGGETALADTVGFDFRGDNAVWVSHYKEGMKLSELRLIGEFTRFVWECQDPVSGNWVRDWYVTGELRPELIRLRTIRGDLEETEVFWIPNYRRVAAQ